MSQVIDLFPRRPVTVKPHFVLTKAGIVVGALGLLMFFAFYGLNIVGILPSVIDDIVHHDAPPVSYGGLEEGKCTSKLITHCELKIAYGIGEQEYRKELNFVTLLQEPDDDRPLVLFADPASPEHVSSNWGRDLLPNRIASQLIWLALMVFIVFAIVRDFNRRKTEKIGMELISKKPQPIVVSIVKHDAAKGYYDTVFKWSRAGSTQLTESRTRFKSDQEPFWLDSTHATALALTDGATHAFLLDDALLAVTSLTQDERNALRAARDKGMA